MKTLLSFIFSLFIFLSVSQTSHAQINTTFTYADGYNVCGESNLKITLKNISSDSIIPIIAEFQLNNAMQAISFGTSEPANQTIISASGNTVVVVFKKALRAASSYDINVKMVSSKTCELSGCGQFFSTTDSLTLTHSNKDFFFYNNNILTSPCLTYDETLFKNRLASAFLGDTITRKIVLKNTGGGKFDGYVQVKDVFGEFVVVESIYTTNPGATVSSAGTTNDSTYLFKGKFSNVLNGDSIVIIERVIVIKCIKQDEGKSSIYINWSCNNALCNEVTPYPIIAQVLKNKKKPQVVITKQLLPESNCLGSNTKYIYTVKNNGTRPAVDLRFTLEAATYDTYTYIHRNTLNLKDTTDLLLTYSSSSQLPLDPMRTDPPLHSFQHSCTIADPLYKWDFGFKALMPGDSFFVETDGFHCCPGSDTTNLYLNFENWNLFVQYKDECLEESFSTNSPGEAETSLGLEQFYEPIITDMHEGESNKATFEIFNNAFTTGFYRLNVENAAFKLKLKLDTGLVYIPNTLKMTSVYGYTLLPTSTQIVPGAGIDGYEDNYLEATFDFPDTFHINKTFFARFMRNSSVVFELKAVCPAREPSCRFTQELYVLPDKSCTQACEVLLSTVSTLISVHCPGCVTPGWVANSHTAKRLNVGERDDDNNRLPDQLTFTLADRSKIKNNRCIPGDTLETNFTAYFQDGDPFTGVTTQQLENNGAKSFEFKYTYVSSKITYGKLFNLNHVKVFISDADHGAITSGVDSITLPLHCVTKILNTNDTLADAEFFFDLSLDTLHKYGIDPSYMYDPGDGLRVVCNYNILEPSTFYLSNPPTTKDPWLANENASILLNSFQNLAYLTGNRNTATDKARADAGDSFKADPTSLDSTMIYWCEGYGSASTIVGKRKQVALGLPPNIQCKERAVINISMNPSGGVFRNAFPFEYRNFLTIDSVRAVVPPGYKFIDWTISNTIPKPDGFLEYEGCNRVDTLKNVTVNGSMISVAIDPLYVRQTEFGAPGTSCLEEPVYGDEVIETTISFSIQPDCDLPEKIEVFYPSPTLYYRVGPDRVPFADKLTREECDFWGNNCALREVVPSATKYNAALQLTPVTNEIQLTKQLFCYPINLEETEGFNANFSFIKIKSLNGKVKAEKLTNQETQEVYLPDADGVFHLDTTSAKSLDHFDLCLSNICGELIEKDTLRIIYGHDCFAYSNATYSNICKFDSIDHYVFPGSLQIGGAMYGPPVVEMCKPFEASVIYNITGIGGIENMLLRLKNDSLDLLTAHMVINDGVETDVLAAFQETTGVFDLKQKILSVKAKGLEAGDKVKMVFTYNTDCEYKGFPIASQAVLITSACDTLYADSLTYIPPIMTGFPTPDSKSILSSYGELKNLGGSVELTINAYNQASVASQNKTRVTLILPAGFTYVSMSSGNAPTQTTDTSLIWDIPVGIPATSSVTFKPVLNYSNLVCDSVVFRYLLSDISTGCANQACVQRDSAFTFKAPVKCYPCPADITLSERCKELPVFNIISWEYPTANYCPDDQNFIYKLYFSKTQNGSYVLLDSTHSKTYTHDSLEEYDGCYYVTVTDLQQGLTTQSEIACKATCREQFQCGDLTIANLMTPNKDGNNDTFKITGAYTTLKVEIYNSWGSTVFKSDNYKNEWDAKGLADGVYYYQIFIDGSDQKCLGWIHVLGGK